jgi:hypothetical protein
MTRVGFELTALMFEKANTVYTSDHAAAVIGIFLFLALENM